jgi:hypothetical protein
MRLLNVDDYLGKESLVSNPISRKQQTHSLLDATATLIRREERERERERKESD